MKIYRGGETLCEINWVHIYLEVYWLSDLATGNGNQVEACYVEGTRIGARTSKYTWKKEKPTMSEKIL